MTIETLKQLKESEHKVEFKEARNNFPFNGGSHTEQEKRRKCLLGYVVAFANERGGTHTYLNVFFGAVIFDYQF